MIKNFQLLNNLKPDGDLGPMTAKAMNRFFGINSLERCAHFLGQCAHESGNFTRGRENLNYSAEGLLKIFPKYFTPDLARQYARQPQKIANRVYANRMGNGDEASGDGWKNRGAGPLQLTGEKNIALFAASVQNPCIKDNPDLIVSHYYFESALFFFNENKLWKFCDKVNDQNILTLSRAINIGNPNSKGTPHGMKDRTEKTYSFYEKLLK